ncbi:MAG TPA: hypothetical protein VFJ56_08975 [Nitrospira sp.]|nr:hypothetical protein [Nitrospira sp.]
MIDTALTRSVLLASTICAIAGIMQACVSSRTSDAMSMEALLTQDGLAVWEREDAELKSKVLAAGESYKKAESLELLKDYEGSVREYLDHGFALYRTYRDAHKTFPAGLVASLEQRTTLFMNVADEFIKQGSIAVGESMASDVVRDYSDLPQMAPAQRRAEAVLLRYRYRQDY